MTLKSNSLSASIWAWLNLLKPRPDEKQFCYDVVANLFLKEDLGDLLLNSLDSFETELFFSFL